MKLSQITKILNLLIKPEDISKKQPIAPLILGEPGIGKSQVVQQFAKTKDCVFIDMRTADIDECDIRGFLRDEIVDGKKIVKWFPPSIMPFKGNSKYDDKKVILFFDEINRAKTVVLQSLFQLIWDRKVGEHELIDSCYILAAGNLGFEDNTDVNVMDSALKNRFITLRADLDLNDWLEWAEGKIHPIIVGFIKKNPTYLLYKKDELHVTPRTWEVLSNIIKINDNDIEMVLETLAYSLIGSITPVFASYVRENDQINIKDILDFDKKKKEFDKLGRDKVYLLNENLIEYIKNNKLTKKQVKNVVSYFNDILQDDNRMAVVFGVAKFKENSNVNDFFMKLNENHKNFISEFAKVLRKSTIGESK